MAKLGFAEDSVLPGVAQASVWARVSTWEGVNHELAPLVRMTHPGRYPTVADVPVDGRCHMVSLFLAFGFLPVEAHRFALRDVRPPEFFDECSSNLLLRVWEHRREVSAVEDGVSVRDIVSLEPRISLLGRPLLALYSWIFRRRHRRLRSYFASRA